MKNIKQAPGALFVSPTKRRRLLLAVVAVAAAAALGVWPMQFTGSSQLLLVFYPAVFFAAYSGGFGVGVLATLLACLTAVFLGGLPFSRPAAGSSIELLGLAVFALSSLAISYFVASLQRAAVQARAAQQEAELAASASAANEQFMKSVVDAVPNMIGYWSRDLHFRFANAAYVKWHGKHPQTLIGSAVKDLMGEALFKLNEPHIRRVLAGEAQYFQRALRKVDGGVGYILANYIPDFDCHGVVQGVFVHASDVTELMQAHAELQLAASVFENTVEGIAVTDARGVFISVNPAFSAITGYSAAEVVGKTARILKSNRHDQAFYTAMWNELAVRGQWKGDIWNRRKDGEVYLERMTITMIRNSSGDSVRYVSVFSDITDLWRKDEYLKHLAFHDALTDLPNRSLLMELLDHQIAIAKREHTGLAVLFIDLDGFKAVNDTFGHEVGDNLLKVVAHRLLVLMRESDTVARLGGDEFVVNLGSRASKDEIAQIANRAIAAINEPIACSGQIAQVGASIGVALFPGDGRTPVELISNADSALYAAKAQGKNTFRFFQADAAEVIPG